MERILPAAEPDLVSLAWVSQPLSGENVGKRDVGTLAGWPWQSHTGPP